MELTELERQRNALVVKSNDLIQRSRFELTAQQQKVVLFLASKVNAWDEDFSEYEFNIQDFCQLCGIDTTSGGNYKALKKTIKEIADKSLWVTLPNGSETLLRWIEKPYLDERSGTIRIRLDKDMKPYLLKLQGNYTQYELIWAIQFKSKYSIRLYELIKSIHYNELHSYERVFTMEELRKALGAENAYPEWKNFKARVLEPATQEINKYSDNKIQYSPITQGKTVTRVWFRVESKLDAEEFVQSFTNRRVGKLEG